MAPRTPDHASEARLERLREEARRAGRVTAAGVRPAVSPLPRPGPTTGYYGRPLLKPPPWTWEIPVYLFVGGATGALAILAAAAQRHEDGAGMARQARWLAVGGAVISGGLLVSDLGRPSRFLHMLRVAKPQSPMSMGVWILVGFSKGITTAAAADLLLSRYGEAGWRGWLLRRLRGAADAGSAVAGALLATYTGVLLGATAVPVWARSIRTLPCTFGMSGLGSAAACLEMLGHRRRGLRILGLLAATAETVLAIELELRHDPALAPVKHGRSGWLVRAGETLAGPAALTARVIGRGRALQVVAASCALVGAALLRAGWFTAGRPSALDPVIPLGLDRDSHAML